jgi:hypothetical protein
MHYASELMEEEAAAACPDLWAISRIEEASGAERSQQRLRAEIPALHFEDLLLLLPRQQIPSHQLANHPPVRRRALDRLHRSSVLPDGKRCRMIFGLSREQHRKKPGLFVENQARNEGVTYPRKL